MRAIRDRPASAAAASTRRLSAGLSASWRCGSRCATTAATGRCSSRPTSDVQVRDCARARAARPARMPPGRRRCRPTRRRRRARPRRGCSGNANYDLLSNSRISSCGACLRRAIRRVWARRLARVSSRFASVTHSTYSRCALGGKPSKVAAGRRHRVDRGAQVLRHGEGRLRGLVADRLHALVDQLHRLPGRARSSSARGGRSSSEVSRPNWPIALSCLAPSRGSGCRPRSRRSACALNAAKPARILPL